MMRVAELSPAWYFFAMKVVVTAGPTREFIDPVRFLSNRSTGKMGYAVAAAFSARGHEVVLISGPVALEPPATVRTVSVVSAADMLEVTLAEFGSCDGLVMAAAVADWAPRNTAERKIKKGDKTFVLELKATRDILHEISAVRTRQVLAGFAAETGDPIAEARRKLSDKGLDVIFANDVSGSDAGFEADTNRIVCITANGDEVAWPLMPKAEAGLKVAETVERIHESRKG